MVPHAKMTDYMSLVKARTVLLVTLCSSLAFVIAARTGGVPVSPVRLLALTAAVAFGTAGSCGLHNYLDMDIDSVMGRTRGRPLPSGRVRPANAVLVGATLVSLGLALALYLGPLTFLLGLLACLDYLAVYTWIMKRRNPLNVLFGSPAGGLPVLAGWSAARGGLAPLGFLLAALVVLWIPNHIWSLATLYSADYRRARVPMLPAVTDIRRALRCTASTVVLLFLLTLYIHLRGFFGTVYLLMTLPMGAALLLGNLWVVIRPSEKGFYRMFKFSSPYLAIVFLSMVLDLAFK